MPIVHVSSKTNAEGPFAERKVKTCSPDQKAWRLSVKIKLAIPFVAYIAAP